MTKRGGTRTALLALALLLAVGVVYGQTNQTTGAVAGTVTDHDGGALPGVSVTVRNEATGLERSTVTDAVGFFRILLLPPASYAVTAELEGFATSQQEGVQVRLGSTAKVRLKILPEISDEILVSSEQVVDTSQRDFTLAVTEDLIDNLPLLGRDFRDLIRLTPGAADTFGGRVTLNGARGVSADYNIDGADANSDFFGQVRGGTEAPFTFSQAAIQEFQVVRSTYSAQYANGVGATLNAITKSGTNQFKGEAFFFRRDADWAADRPDMIGDQQVTGTFEGRNSDQFGFALGGPIVKNKFHFFTNVDIQDITESLILADIRLDSDYQALPPETRAAFEGRVESLLGNSLDDEFGLSSDDDQETFMVKVDGSLSPYSHGSVRYTFSENTNAPSEGARDIASNNGVEQNEVNSAVFQLESVFGSSMFNEALVQFSMEELAIAAANTRVPEAIIRSNRGVPGITIGQSEFLPNGTNEDKIQIKDAFSLFKGDHELKFGFEYWQADIDNLFPRERAGQFQFGSIDDFLANRPFDFDQGLGPTDGLNAFDYETFGVFFHDTLRVGTKWTLDLGVRWDTQSIPKPVTNAFPQYPEFLTNFKDDDNIAPRFGFAWDIKGDGHSVLRGGVGLYYDFLPSILYATPLSEIGFLFNRISVNCNRNPCPEYPNIFGPEEFAENLRTSSEIRTVGSGLEATESLRTSLGWERQLGETYSFSVEGVYADISDAQRLRNVNAVPTGLVFGNLVVYDRTSPDRPFPDFINVMEHTSDAEGEYKALTVSLRKAPRGRKYGWLAHYTWSEAIDQDSNERSTSTSFSLDPFNPKISEGRADYDIEHRFLASGSYQLPAGVLVSGILTWRSGVPYTPGLDVNIFFEGLNGLDRTGVDTPVFVDSSGRIVDMTLANGFTDEELAAFLADARVSERNSRNQPSFFRIDLRVSKYFNLGDRFGLELIGEAFNLLDTENEFTTNTTLFEGDKNGDVWEWVRDEDFGKPNTFTFASLPRQIQVAVKFVF